MIDRRALVVEDSPTYALLMTAELEQIGWRVRCVDNPSRALALLALDPAIELVITDYDLPDMDGVEMIRRLRADPRLRSVAAIVVTGLPTDDIRAEAYAAGVAAVLSKDLAFALLPDLLLAADRH